MTRSAGSAPGTPDCAPALAPHIEITSRAAGGGKAAFRAAFGTKLVALTPDRDERKLSLEDIAKARLADQADFINSLWSVDADVSYGLRLRCTPLEASPLGGEISVCLFGEVTGTTEGAVVEKAQSLSQGLRLLCGAHFRDADWATITDAADFAADWEPFDWDKAHSVEICRRTENLRLETVRERPALGKRDSTALPPAGGGAVYFVHPFLPRLSTWERLLRVLLHAPHPTALTVTLAPTTLTVSERDALLREIVKCEQALADADGDVHAARARALRGVLEEQSARLADAPFELHVTLSAPCALPPGLADAVAVEMTAPVGARSDFLHEGAATLLQAGGYDLLHTTPTADLAPHDPADDSPGASLADLRQRQPAAAPPSADLARLAHLVDGYEAATAFRLPIATRDGLPGLLVRSARRLPVPRIVTMSASAGGVHIGESCRLDHSQPVFISERDRRQHMYVVGQTGTGKTTLLKHMILDDMRAGHGLAVFDPHGDLFEELLQSIPPDRLDDVIVLDPSDTANPVGLNLLECAAEEDRHTVIREMTAIMYRLMQDRYGAASREWMGPVFFQHMQMNMLLAMSNPDEPGTLLQFYEIYHSPEFWKRWVPPTWSDPLLERWIDGPLEAARYLTRSGSDATMGEWLSSKFDDFVFDPMLRLIFGQRRSTIDFLDIMDSGKILLVNLAKGRLTETNSAFLGMVIMAKLQVAAMRRGRTPSSNRAPFYLYVDEFQNLATDNFVLLLSEARKFGLGMVLANQFVSQIDNQRIMDAIFGNVGTLCAFRVGRKDADLLESQFTPYFTDHDLANLPNWEACLRTTVDGQIAPPFTVETVLRDDMPSSAATAVDVRARSARKYGHPRDEVMAEIASSLRPPGAPAATRRSERSAASRRDDPRIDDLIKAGAAMSAAQAGGDERTKLECIRDFARASSMAGNVESAEQALQDALKMTDAVEDQTLRLRSRSRLLTDLALVACMTSAWDAAIAHAKDAIAIDRQLKRRDWERGDLRVLADAYDGKGDVARAARARAQAAALAAQDAPDEASE